MSRFINKGYPLEIINNIMYEILAEYPIERVLNINLIKEWLSADTAFKVNRRGVYIFCREVQDVEWEEIIEKKII